MTGVRDAEKQAFRILHAISSVFGRGDDIERTVRRAGGIKDRYNTCTGSEARPTQPSDTALTFYAKGVDNWQL